MAKILIYNNNRNRMETYYRGLSEAMPYISNRTLTVREFRANSVSNILWSSTQTMNAWNSFRYIYGRSIYVGFAFKRCWEGGHRKPILTNLKYTLMKYIKISNDYSLM